MKIIVLFALIVSLIGCSSGRTTNEVFIRDTTYIKVPEIIQGGGTPQIITDTIIQYSELKGIDTVVKFQWLPAKKIVEYVVKPDTVKFNVRDTIYKSIIVEKIVETPFLAKIGLIFFGFVLTLIGIAIYNERIKK